MHSPQRFRKKPVVIEAIQFDGTNATQVSSFIGENYNYSGKCDYFEIETLEGVMKARPGWWIIKGVAGEYYPCAPDIFNPTYEAVS